jgi:hypothetical protein
MKAIKPSNGGAKVEKPPETVNEIDRVRWALVQEQIARTGEQQLRLDREMRELVANRIAFKQRLCDEYKLGPMDSFDVATGVISRAT